jgi:uncharacterized protein (DUF924 family)
MLPAFDSVLSFWFGELDAEGFADAAHAKRWFQGGPDFDSEIRSRFAALHAEVESNKHDDWLATPKGRLALVIVLDQFSRNMFRHTPRMFESDPRALEVALAGIGAGQDRTLAFAERPFLYMPLMHSEAIAMQDRSVELFTRYRDEVPAARRELAAENLRFAERHREIIRHFGRFPHRNAVFERTSTGEEVEFLKQPGSSF